MRWPYSWRMGNQWSATTSGGSVSNAAAQGTKCSEVSMSSLEGVTPDPNSRRLPFTCRAQLWSAVKVLYLFGRRSSFTPVGKAASCRGVLFSPSLACFLEGDGCGLQSSRCHFRLRINALLSEEELEGSWLGRSSSEMTIVAMSSGSSFKGV